MPVVNYDRTGVISIATININIFTGMIRLNRMELLVELYSRAIILSIAAHACTSHRYHTSFRTSLRFAFSLYTRPFLGRISVMAIPSRSVPFF